MAGLKNIAKFILRPSIGVHLCKNFYQQLRVNEEHESRRKLFKTIRGRRLCKSFNSTTIKTFTSKKLNNMICYLFKP